MKSTRTSLSMSIHCSLLWVGIVFSAWMSSPLSAQSPGTEAQGSGEMASTAPSHKAHPKSTKTKVQPFIPQPSTVTAPIVAQKVLSEAGTRSWEQNFVPPIRPSQPQRPIPWILTLLGLLCMLIWGAILVGAILTAGTTLGIVLLVATIVFSVLLVLGLVLFIGGLIAGLSGGKKRRPAPQTPENPGQ